MKNIFLVLALGASGVFIAAASGAMAQVDHDVGLKLPYPAGISLMLIQGYDSPPTHIHKDADALDLSGAGCDAYGVSAVAAAPGTVILAIVFSQSTFNSSTLSVDLAWQAPASSTDSGMPFSVFEIESSAPVFIATTTAQTFSYLLADQDYGSTLQFAVALEDASATTITVPVPPWQSTLQPIDTENSNGSWYDDNWYDLGTGFYATIKSITLKGFIDSSQYAASHVWLDEYLDSGYTKLNQTFTISDDAPFVDGIKTVTLGGLAIPLQPNKFYRLRTLQDWQNRSVILAGTSATGTAMWDQFIAGTGGVQHIYPFYPYLSAIMIPQWPPLMPPNPPAGLAVAFDAADSTIALSWPAAMDPDTTSSLLTYQIAVATGTSPVAESDWRSVGSALGVNLRVAFGNTYTFGIRASDDFAATSTAVLQPWDFPAGYAPQVEQLDHAAPLPGGEQAVTLLATTTISGIALWIQPQLGDFSCCAQSYLSIWKGQVLVATSTPVTVNRYNTDQEQTYAFPAPIVLASGGYSFHINVGPGSPTNGTNVFGSASDTYPGGGWSTAPGQDAYFRFIQTVGP